MSGGKRLRILMLAPLPPWPVNNGSKVRIFHLARLLAARHDVTLVVPVPEGVRAAAGLEAALPGVHVRVIPSRPAQWRPITAARAVFSTLPWHVSEAWHPAFARTVADESLEPVDVLHVFHLTMVQYARHARARFTVYDPMGNESLYMERMVAVAPRARASLLRLNLQRVRRYEAWAASRFDAVVPVSALEADYFRRLARSDARIVPIPIAPDTARLLSLESRPAGPVVLFSGSLDWYPNVDAAQFLARRIWPLVSRAVQDAQLWLAGKDPGAGVLELGQSERVRIIANPDSMLPLLQSAAVVAVPVRTGSGTKIKTVEAMAAGKAVVTTTLGCEGWDVDDGRHVRIADEPAAFADAIVGLLKNEAARDRLGQSARELVRERYTAERMVAAFEALYDSGLTRRGAA